MRRKEGDLEDKKQQIAPIVTEEAIMKRMESFIDPFKSDHINYRELSRRVFEGAYEGITYKELDTLLCEVAASRAIKHPDYGALATRVSVTNLHKETSNCILEVAARLVEVTEHKGELISRETYEIIKKHKEEINKTIDYNRDFEYSFFGYKTLERSYLFKINEKVIERPQHMIVRAAVGIHGDDISAVLETYSWISQRYFIHGSPVFFNGGTNSPQMSSCFLVSVEEDTVDGIMKQLTNSVKITKSGGGLGLSIHSVRSSGSLIKSTNGISNGLVPVLRMFDSAMRFVDQGGKRPGSCAMYLEPWHSDIFEFLNLKKNTGKEELRARDLFYGLWVPDLFMKRVENNENWSLMSSSEAPGLADVWGVEFERMYTQYETEGRARRVVPAQKLWREIITAQIETGMPYMLYKDACNRKSNQKNLGTIKSSNLCTEIIQYTSKDEIAVCNLGSLGLGSFVDQDRNTFDFKMLNKAVRALTRNLNKVIDRNMYPVEEAKRSNYRHRPIGIGVQGLADTFMLLDLSFESEGARKLNKEIFETIYYGALWESCELSKEKGTYETYKGSPVSLGLLQFDLWNVSPENTPTNDWALLRKNISKHGVRNSLLVAPMPTASTSQILGFNESFEPYTSNIYIRRVLSGEFQIVNPHLVKKLSRLGLWNDEVRTQLIADNGSIQEISCIPKPIRDVFKTVWEISQKTILQMAIDRSPYIDQSQSLNIHVADPTYSKITSMHFYGWKGGLKTGMYYLRSKSPSEAIKFTIDQEKLKRIKSMDLIKSADSQVENDKMENQRTCLLENDSNCSSCGG